MGREEKLGILVHERNQEGEQQTTPRKNENFLRLAETIAWPDSERCKDGVAVIDEFFLAFRQPTFGEEFVCSGEIGVGVVGGQLGD